MLKLVTSSPTELSLSAKWNSLCVFCLGSYRLRLVCCMKQAEELVGGERAEWVPLAQGSHIRKTPTKTRPGALNCFSHRQRGRIGVLMACGICDFIRHRPRHCAGFENGPGAGQCCFVGAADRLRKSHPQN